MKLLVAGIIIGLVVAGIPAVFYYNEAGSLAKDLDSCQARLQEIEANLSTCRDQVSRLESEKRELLGKLEEARAEKRALEEELASVKTSLENLQAKYEALNAEYEELKSNYTALLEDYEALEDKLNSLTKNYQDLLREHQSVLWAIHNASLWHGYTYEKDVMINFYTGLLENSTIAVTEIVPLSFYSRLGVVERVYQVFEDTLYFLAYCYDDYVRIPDPSDPASITVWDEVHMLPNETWENGCGDCDDLALFVYAILEATRDADDTVYIIGVYWEDYGHWAVLYIERGPSGMRYYVIDPAGNYVNGLQLYYKMRVYNYTAGTHYTVYLVPLNLDYTEKAYLEGAYKPVYWDLYESREYPVEDAPLYYYTDLYLALYDWITYWSDNGEVVEYEVVGEGVWETFTTLAQLANWITSQAAQG